VSRFALVLHTHLPYVRRNGVWPSGEDFFHQAATEAYLPLLATFRRLAARGVRSFATVGMTPVVAHQMQDEHMLRELHLYLGRYEERALRQVTRYDGRNAPEVRDLAAFYALFGREQLALLESLPSGIASAYGDLERDGAIEILGGPITHALLPRITDDRLRAALLELGVSEHERTFGRFPRGIWLPECAYAPDVGLEETLSSLGVTHTVVDGPTVVGLGDRATYRAWDSRGLGVFARNLEISYKVWSPTGGYPTGAAYRDFHFPDREAGFKNWAVTDYTKGFDFKEPYNPAPARAQAVEDAGRFVVSLEEALEDDPDGVVVACFDTELYGHWWFEGPIFLESLFERLAEHPWIRPVTLERALAEGPPLAPAALPEGTWGFRKDWRSWFSEDTEAMWKTLEDAERETMRLAAAHPNDPALPQLMRELFLLQSSDWPFMMIRGRNPGYARERFESHAARWSSLADAIMAGDPGRTLLAERTFAVDNFPLAPETAAIASL
jgi:1,4-alpha-glucan branching enzyme